jgi:hypothetical protein
MAKKKNDALVKWDEEFAKAAEQAVEAEKSVGAGGNMIKLSGGAMSYQGGALPGNKISAVVLDSILHNAWYPEAYDPDNPKSPDCYAFGRDEKTMAPHPDSVDKQSDTCAACPKNQFGTADKGRGKACKNQRRLALMTENDLENIPGAEIAHLHVPPTSIRAWAGYVRQVGEIYHRPPFGLVTEIERVPDQKDQFHVTFTAMSVIDDGEACGQLFEKHTVAEEGIEFPYTFIEPPTAPPARGVRRGAVPQPAPVAVRGAAKALPVRGAAPAALPARKAKFV